MLMVCWEHGTFLFIYFFILNLPLTREGKVEETSHHTAQFMIKQAAGVRRVLI